MKKLMLAFALMLATTTQAQASFWDVIGAIAGGSSNTSPQSHHRPPPGYPHYNVTCSYSDAGYEEHFWGHSSCGDCLQDHGRCIETCSAEISVCEAKGVDAAGILTTVTAEASDRYEAERRAYDSCYYHGLRDCRVDNCTTRQDQVSRRECRR